MAVGLKFGDLRCASFIRFDMHSMPEREVIVALEQ